MKKIINLMCLILLMTGCNKITTNDNMISQITEKQMLEKSNISDETIVEENSEIEDTKEDENTYVIDNYEVINEPKKDVSNNNQMIVDDDEVDDNTLDYQIHKGRIDCLDIDDCINQSLPIQFELKNTIDDVFYLEVKTKSNKSLGYFISYSFKNYKYDDYDTCLEKEEYLKKKLADRIISHECTNEGFLIVESDYNGEIDD